VYSPENDKAFLEAGIPELEDYLLSNELYWPVSARGLHVPRLTIGSLYLAEMRLKAVGAHTPVYMERIEATRSRRRVAWENKANREFHSRSRLWQSYITEYRQAPEQNADAYPQEVRLRVILNLLLAEFYTPPAEQETVSRLDEVVRLNFVPGNFVWDTSLQTGFPCEEYWYLYGTLKH